MKKYFLTLSFVSLSLFGQKNPLQVDKIILDNGLTILLNQDDTAKEVFGAVVVKAGSKNDPKDATGLAHYLEHLLFKGTDKLGTTDYQSEKKHLDSIVYWYDELGKTKDENQRKTIQKEINKQSVKASKFALPTETFKLISEFGGSHTNAFTTNDKTVYYNYFPSEQIEKWMKIYAERFRNPVFRSFQSELEVVYEEKNKANDNFTFKIYEDLLATLFPNHPYGTQSIIGTTEHLKNPSLRKMYEFFKTYYVANNMAVILSGNFKSEEVIPLLKQEFSKLQKGIIHRNNFVKNDTFKENIFKNVRYTPIKAEIIAYKTVNDFHKDQNALNVIAQLLFNQNETGKLNQLKTDGKVLFSGASNFPLNDDGVFGVLILPKLLFQSFDKAENLVLSEIEKIKKGEFTEEELQTIKQNLSIEKQNALEKIESRGLIIADLFSNDKNWEDYLQETKEIEKLTKDDIVKIANHYFSKNKLVYRSRMGFPKKTKIEKPAFEPVQFAKNTESGFAKELKNTSKNSEAKFVNFNESNYSKINESVDLYCNENKINDIFSLKIEKQIGGNSLKSTDLISKLFNEFYTETNDLKTLKKKFSELGITIYPYSNENRFYVEFKGLESNLQQAIPLINELLNHPKVSEKSIKNAINEQKAGIKFLKKSPNQMGFVLTEFARFGNQSKYINTLTINDLKNFNENKIIEEYQKINSYNTTLFYTGKKSIEEVKEILKPIQFSNQNKKEVLKEKENQSISKTSILYLKDKKTTQNQIYLIYNLDEKQLTSKERTIASFYDEYLFGGFSGILLQEVRELRSLAYSSNGEFKKSYLNQKDGVIYAYVGSQADKTDESIETVQDIFKNFPQKPERIESIKSFLQKNTSSKLPQFREYSQKINELKQFGFNEDPLKKEYQFYDEVTFDDLKSFHKKHIENKPFTITIYGNLSESSIEKLKKIGEFKEIKINDVLQQ